LYLFDEGKALAAGDIASVFGRYLAQQENGDVRVGRDLSVGNDLTVTDGATVGGTLNAANVDTGNGATEIFDMNQDLRTDDNVAFATVNTGQGANELYDMNQDLRTDDDVTFASVNTGDLSVSGKGSLPIGATYLQLPSQSAPDDIFTGTWSNISSSYAGDFFRAEGGSALAFSPTNLTEQLDQMQRITGEGPADASSTHSISFDGAFSFVAGGAGPGGQGDGGKFYFDSADSPDARTSTTTDGETFPVNRTIRIWKRIS